MIRVELVKTKDGLLVGRTASDRWNLETAGIGPLVWDRNQRSVKAARRRLVKLGLTLTVVRDAAVQIHPTDAECYSLGLVIVHHLTERAA